MGCVDSANLTLRIRGERLEERKSWGWRFPESGQELERDVRTGLCVRLCVISVYMFPCVHVCLCACAHAPASLCHCMSVSMGVHVSVRKPVCTPAHAQLVHVPVCAHASACVWGGSVSCCSAVQHLTPHIIRGIPAILGTRPRQFWENGSFWKGWECFLLW